MSARCASRGICPIASEFHPVPEGENDVADGIQIREPTRKRQLLNAIAETDGDAIAITEDDVQTELDRLHRHGFYVEPTSAIVPAALAAYQECGTLGADADVMMPVRSPIRSYTHLTAVSVGNRISTEPVIPIFISAYRFC